MIEHGFYLTDRADAHGRQNANECGPERLALAIAGLNIEITGLDAVQLAVARREYAAVMAHAPAMRPLTLAVRAARPAWFRQVELNGAEYRIALSYDAGGAWLSGLSFVARFSRAPQPSTTLWVEPGTRAAFEGALVNALRVLVAHALHARGGIVLHSAAIESAGRAFVFFGPSGVGKTTLSRLSAAVGRDVISDELNALVPASSGFEVLALPFAGDFGRTVVRRAAVPLAAAFRLRQGPEHALAQLSPAAAAAALLASSPYVNADPRASEELLGRMPGLIESLRPSELHFALDSGFWALVEGHRPA